MSPGHLVSITSITRDDAILEACAACDAGYAAIHEWNAGRLSWEVGEAVNGRWWQSLAGLASMAPVTFNGLKAKAGVMQRAILLVGLSCGPLNGFVAQTLAQIASAEAFL